MLGSWKGTKATKGTEVMANQRDDEKRKSNRTAGDSAQRAPRPIAARKVAKDAPGPGFIPPHGGYQNLLAFQRAEFVFDATVAFCARMYSPRDRMCDQMIQAARSGKQNIGEGSQVSGTSKEAELKLTNVARASLEELLMDYRDFLRLRGAEEWSREHKFAVRLGQLLRTPNATYEVVRPAMEHEDPAIAANAILGVIKVTCYLLDRQLARLEKDFLAEGGLRERMTQARLEAREEQRRRRNRWGSGGGPGGRQGDGAGNSEGT